MLITERNEKEICKYLFQEGVCYAKKDYNLEKHPEIDVPNLQVIKLMQSFKSKEYVRENFAWMHYYWCLTNAGIDYLRTCLNLPSEIVPATLKKQTKTSGRDMGPLGGRPRGPTRVQGFGDRDGYSGGLVARKVMLQLITSLHSLVEGVVSVEGQGPLLMLQGISQHGE